MLDRFGALRREAALVALGAAVLTAAIYGPALRYYLVNDDFHWLAGARDFTWKRLFTIEGRDHFYRPLVDLYFAAAFRTCGIDAVCLHALNLVLHTVNVVLVWMLARAPSLSRGGRAAPLLAALLFAVQPSHTEAVMWVAAVTELLPTMFFLATVLVFLEFLRGRGRAAYVASVVTFAAALAVHESAAMLLPLLWVCARMEGAGRARATAALFAPFAVLLAGYLWVEYDINSRSYLIRDGHYALGLHALPNMARYLVLFYVGRRDVVSLVLSAVGLAAALVLGRGGIRFAAVWIAMTLLPFAFFTWGVSFRYAYLPAVGFALLLAALLSAMHESLRKRWPAPATWAVAAIAAGVVFRFAVFAQKSVVGYEPLGTAYERYLDRARDLYPELPASRVLVLPDPRNPLVERVYVKEMLRLEYRAPTLEVTFRD